MQQRVGKGIADAGMVPNATERFTVSTRGHRGSSGSGLHVCPRRPVPRLAASSLRCRLVLTQKNPTTAMAIVVTMNIISDLLRGA